jgi:hypothetical protein
LRLRRGLIPLRRVQRLGRCRTALVGGGAFRLPLLELRVGGAQRGIQIAHSRLHRARRCGIRRGKGMHLGGEALAPLAESMHGSLVMREVGTLELQAALGLLQRAARLVRRFLSGAESVLRLRQEAALVLELAPCLDGALLGGARARSPHVQCLR